MKKKFTHGGKRPGAGREKIDPTLLKILMSFRFSPQIARWLKTQDRPARDLIEEALCKQFKIKNN